MPISSMAKQLVVSSLSIGRLNVYGLATRLVLERSGLSQSELSAIVWQQSLARRELVDEVLESCLTSGWLRIDGRGVSVGVVAERLRDQELRYPDEPAYRELLFAYMQTLRPAWSTMLTLSRPEFRSCLSPTVDECFEAASLWRGHDPDVALWWDRAADLCQRWSAEYRQQLGTRAEQLTLAHERCRLQADGLEHLLDGIRWVATEDSSAGFDVASHLGGHSNALGGKPTDALRIEVKAMAGSARHEIRFYLTRNEWRVAAQNPASYLFYIWAGVRLGSTREGRLVRILSPRQMQSLLPADTTDQAEWTESLVTMPATDSAS